MNKRTQYNSFIVLLNIVIWGLIAFVLHYLTVEEEGIEDDLRLLKTMVIIVSVFYLNYFVLIPYFLSKRKFKYYGFSILAVMLFIFAISYYTELPFENTAMGRIPGPPDFPAIKRIHPPKSIAISLGILVLSTVSIAVSTGVRGTKEWFKNENQLKEIENKKLSAELSYLKAQINPHFFFNTLNGIYALAMKKSDKTPEVIMMLSVLMRYIIYDAKAPKVLLKKELSHISNFIDLQKIRLSEMVKIDYRITGSPKDIMIEPLLFSVLVENAFKHGIDYSKRTTIKIHLDIEDNLLHFIVSNPVVVPKKKMSKFGDDEAGIGLDNIKKRLELLYPNRHELTIFEDSSLYTVELRLILEDKKP
ncbi:sensor histidine kinase [Mangrovibacterium diazotrophicum]|uniref:Histidine kinase n=1 Tax=Mangrovibacterium diazotrophicum TaxID=1261403 RepID=A0A419W3P8_9BACT|nr:histidine kinase [Mangrovibacterium diazotrophicum]RKD90098.1 histidine kinase [Mangrovibacterium diazotrophicum]